MSNTEPTKKPGMTSVNACYKTVVVFLIYTVKFGKSVGSKGEKKHLLKVKHILSYDIWIFRNDQPDCDDDRNFFVAMTST